MTCQVRPAARVGASKVPLQVTVLPAVVAISWKLLPKAGVNPERKSTFVHDVAIGQDGVALHDASGGRGRVVCSGNLKEHLPSGADAHAAIQVDHAG